MGVSDEDDRTIVDLLTDQIEFANVIVINKCDLVTDTEAERLEGILHHLNPDARMLRVSRGRVDLSQIIGTGLYDEEAASRMPGWAKELEGDHIPETEEYGIGSFVYRRRKPFHPQRLLKAIGTGLEGVVRSKGFLWIASRPDKCGIWSQAGSSLQIDRGGLWFAAVEREQWPDDPMTRDWLEDIWDDEVGDCRQEIVFIGVEMDRQGIEAALDEALVTTEEMTAGPPFWMQFEDPLPPWDQEGIQQA